MKTLKDKCREYLKRLRDKKHLNDLAIIAIIRHKQELRDMYAASRNANSPVTSDDEN